MNILGSVESYVQVNLDLIKNINYHLRKWQTSPSGGDIPTGSGSNPWPDPLERGSNVDEALPRELRLRHSEV